MMDRTALYRIWKDSELLYIGVSYNPWGRFQNHMSAKDWGKTATRMDIEWHESRDDALRAERLAIAAENPRANLLDVSGDISGRTGRAAPLAAWLAKTGMSQADFANAVGIHFTAVCRILKNQRRPTKQKAQKIEALSGGAVPASIWGFKVPKTKCQKFLADVKRLHSEGATFGEIADKLGVSITVVRNVALKAGLRANKKERTSKYEAALRECAERGMNQTQAAMSLGVAQAVVSATAKRLGIAFVDGRANRKRSEAKVERIRNLAAMGLTVTQVAKEMGIHQADVSKIKKQYGIHFPVSGRLRKNASKNAPSHSEAAA